MLAPATVHRLLAQHGLNKPLPTEPSSKDRRHFAYEQAGELWMSDVMHGPSVPESDKRKRKTYLISFLDDATRVVPYGAFAFSESTAAFLPVFEQAIQRRGIPKRLYVDYVPRHIIDVLCPVVICAQWRKAAQKQANSLESRHITMVATRLNLRPG